MDLIFKTKRTINLANSCYRREPRLETFRLRNSDCVSTKAAVGAEGSILQGCTAESRDHCRAVNGCVSTCLF